MGSTNIDTALLAALKDLKTHPMNFAFVGKTVKDGALIVSKTKIAPPAIESAKKKFGGTSVQEGSCFYEGGKLIFELPEPPAATMAAALKEVIKRDTATAVQPICRMAAQPTAGAMAATGATNAAAPTGGPKAVVAGVAAGGADLAKAVQQRLQTVGGQLAQAVKSNAPNAGQLNSLFAAAQNYAKNNLLDKAVDALNTVDAAIKARTAAAAKGAAPGQNPTASPMGAQRGNAPPTGGTQVSGNPPGSGHAPASGNAPASGWQTATGATKSAPVGAPPTGSNPAKTGPTMGTQRGNAPAPNYQAMGGKSPSAPDQSGPAQSAPGQSAPPRSPPQNPSTTPYEPFGKSPAAAPPGSSPAYQTFQKKQPPVPPVPAAASSAAPVQNQNFQTKQNPNQPPQSPNPVPFTFTGRAPRQGENLIPSAWAKTVNLANLDRCKLEIPNANSTDALKGGNGQLGFIKSPDPKSPIVPPLVMKISLDASKTSELENERNAYEKLGDNPRFLKCLGLAVVGGQRGLVMERVNGTDMKKTLEAFKTGYESGDVSHEEFWGTVQFTLRETIRGLQDLEQAGIVHHDIAPDNLICDRATGNVKIFDFGSATGERHQGGVNLPIGKGMVSPDYITKDSYGDPKMDPEGITPKHDAFGAGQIAYQAGEKDIFRYHDQSGNTPNLNALLAFKTMAFADSESDEDEEDESAANQAIRPADSANPAFTPLPKSEENKKAGQFAGTPKHVPGRKGASTRYTEFVNKLMHPDPTKRMSLADALKHPFLSDSLMTDEQAKQFLVLNMPGVRPRLGGG